MVSLLATEAPAHISKCQGRAHTSKDLGNAKHQFAGDFPWWRTRRTGRASRRDGLTARSLVEEVSIRLDGNGEVQTHGGTVGGRFSRKIVANELCILHLDARSGNVSKLAKVDRIPAQEVRLATIAFSMELHAGAVVFAVDGDLITEFGMGDGKAVAHLGHESVLRLPDHCVIDWVHGSQDDPNKARRAVLAAPLVLLEDGEEGGRVNLHFDNVESLRWNTHSAKNVAAEHPGMGWPRAISCRMLSRLNFRLLSRQVLCIDHYQEDDD